MKRRDFLKHTVQACAGIAFGSIIFCCQKRQKRAPNILIFVSDDTGWNDVGYHNPEIKTPNIDRLARQGVELDNFYVSPVCSPTRAALLTGRPPSRFGIIGPIAGRSELALPKGTMTLAELLRQHGYQTAITGKWHLGLKPELGPRQYGFDYSYGYFHGQLDQFTHIYKNGDRTWHRNDQFVDEDGHATDLITNEAIRFIRELRDETRPFFLYVPFSVPHFPVQEEKRWEEMYSQIENECRRLYAASMTHMDDGMGQILAVIEEEGLADDTLVIYFSDNGGQESWSAGPDYYGGKFRPCDQLGDNRPLRGWKGELYEGGIRVPAAVYWKGRLQPRQVTEVIAVQDLYPSIADLVGAEISSDWPIEGMDIWQALNGGALPPRVLYWRTKGQFAVRRGNWKLIHTGESLERGEQELFDLAQDPFEQDNLITQWPAMANELMGELLKQASLDTIYEGK
ncbi:MAG: sulfatase-like hydrolase/transferase [candidate division KSB1 bacterium]|nr:sulfatase-like hydrolase/transferase [candidate division KSB1 bacterium]